jgi:hypothetical protein
MRRGTVPRSLSGIDSAVGASLRLAELHAAERRLPAIERRRADPVLPGTGTRSSPSLMLRQYPDDLLSVYWLFLILRSLA